MTLLLFGTIGVWELVIVAGIVLLLFGTRIPSVMRNLGKGVSSFKKGLAEGREEDDESKPGKQLP